MRFFMFVSKEKMYQKKKSRVTVKKHKTSIYLECLKFIFLLSRALFSPAKRGRTILNMTERSFFKRQDLRAYLKLHNFKKLSFITHFPSHPEHS